ncbi:MAG: hypothetical protein MR919_03080 [Parabacteroides sp.]|nr:hypothetical protein [Parabacteroides sp.]
MGSFTTLGKGHNAPCLPITPEEWLAARKDPKLAALCQRIKASHNASQQRKLKSQLPVWTPRCGAFKENHRAEVDALCHLDRLMFDIDEKGQTDRVLSAVRMEGEQAYIGDFEVLLIERSVRDGTHVLVKPLPGKPIPQQQVAFSEAVQLPVDSSVKNVAGCIYLVPQSHVCYESPRFFEPKVMDVSDLRAPAGDVVRSLSTGDVARNVSTTFPSAYEGIPIDTIIQSLVELLGGAPEHGSRNQFIFSLACYARYLCQSNPEWIRQVLPTFGEEAEKAWSTIRSACNRSQPDRLPELVERALQQARTREELKQVKQPEPETFDLLTSSYPPAMPERLPASIQKITSRVPSMYKPCVAFQSFSALGAHLKGVYVVYIDNVPHELGGQIGILMAGQSTGKSCVNQPIEVIMADILASDRQSREVEQEWKIACKRAKSNEKKPARPAGICVQYLMSNMTNAALVQRLIDADAAGGKCLFLRLDEIELLDQIKATGGAKASELIRLAYDRSLYGQERVGPDSVTGIPPLRLNVTASTTVESGIAYIRPHLKDGTFSRASLCTIFRPQGDLGLPKYGTYDEDYRKALAPHIERLNEAIGLIDCPEAYKLAEELYRENEERYVLSADEDFRELSYRSLRIAYDRAVMIYLMEGCQWSDEIADFMRWLMEYDLWVKLYYFADELWDLRQRGKRKKGRPGRGSLLRKLPDRFDFNHFQAVYQANGLTGDPKDLLYTWVHRGHVSRDEASGMYSKFKTHNS